MGADDVTRDDCTCERFSAVSFFRVDDPTCPYHHPSKAAS